MPRHHEIKRGVSLLGKAPPGKGVLRRRDDYKYPELPPNPSYVRDYSDRLICWVCLGTGGKSGSCPECGGRGRSPTRPSCPQRGLFIEDNKDADIVNAWISYDKSIENPRRVLSSLGINAPLVIGGVFRHVKIGRVAFQELLTTWDVKFKWGPEPEKPSDDDV